MAYPRKRVKFTAKDTEQQQQQQQQIVPRKRVKKWGMTQKDFVTVKITTMQSNKKRNSAHDFTSVQYTSYPELNGDEHNLQVRFYNNCNLQLETGISVTSEMITALEPLKTEIELMKNLIEADQDISWDIFSVDDMPSNHGLCYSLMRAFLFGMDDTNGKQGLTCLLSAIIKSLDHKPALEVLPTRSPSHISCFATSVKMNNMVIQSSSSPAEHSTEDSKSSCAPESRRTHYPCSIPISTKRDLYVAPETERSSSSDCFEMLKSQVSTSDVLVFPHRQNLDKPIQTKLVVSIKKGGNEDITPLVKELLSRLPYQSDFIFGLHINAVGATLCSVRLERDGEDPAGKVPVLAYQPYTFRKRKGPFCVEAFWNMILDIGSILSI